MVKPEIPKPKVEVDVEIQFSYSCPFCKALEFFSIDEAWTEMTTPQKIMLKKAGTLLKQPYEKIKTDVDLKCSHCGTIVNMSKLRW